jgi:cytochrome P450
MGNLYVLLLSDLYYSCALHAYPLSYLYRQNFLNSLSPSFRCHARTTDKKVTKSIVTQWKRSRELLRRQFVRIQYQDVKVFEGPINNLLATLSSSTGVVDLQPEFFRFTLATTTSLIFGEPFAGLNPSDHETFAENFDYCSLIGTLRLRLANFCFLYNPPKFKRACTEIKRYATHYVNHALKDMEEKGEESASERHPFILDLYKELQDRILVRDQLMNVLIAGRDTTACLLSWSL